MQFPTQSVMQLSGSPTMRMALSQRLQQSAKEKNDGTVLGGAASMFDAYLSKRERRKDQEEQGKLSKALMEGLTKEHHAGAPEELGGEGLTTMEPGVANALQRIAESGLGGTERGGRLTQMLAMQKFADQRQAAALADQRAYAEQQTQGQRDWQSQQTEAQRAFQMDMLGRQQAFQRSNRPAPQRRIVNINGLPFYADTGEPVVPGVQATPKERRIVKGADGKQYYADTREPVLPGIMPQATAPTVRTIKQPDGSEVAVQFNGQTGKWDRMDAPQGGAAVGDPRKKLTENQSKLTLFKSQILQTAPLLSSMETELGYDPTNFGDAAARSIAPELLSGFFKSEQGQQYQALSSAWAEGVLRIQTGAAATQPEIERVQTTYFPRPGDDADTVKLKRAMRDAYQVSIDAALGGEVPQGTPDPMVFAIDYMRRNKPAGTPAPGDIGNGIQSLPPVKPGIVRRRYNPATGKLEVIR